MHSSWLCFGTSADDFSGVVCSDGRKMAPERRQYASTVIPRGSKWGFLTRFSVPLRLRPRVVLHMPFSKTALEPPHQNWRLSRTGKTTDYATEALRKAASLLNIYFLTVLKFPFPEATPSKPGSIPPLLRSTKRGRGAGATGGGILIWSR